MAVDMAEDMVFGFLFCYCGGEVGATMGDWAVLVKNTGWGSVGYQDVYIWRDHGPFFLQCFPSWQGKGIAGDVVKCWLPWGSVDGYAVDNYRFIQKICCFREKGLCFLGIAGQSVVVVATDDDFMSMGK